MVNTTTVPDGMAWCGLEVTRRSCDFQSALSTAVDSIVDGLSPTFAAREVQCARSNRDDENAALFSTSKIPQARGRCTPLRTMNVRCVRRVTRKTDIAQAHAPNTKDSSRGFKPHRVRQLRDDP